MITVCAVTAGLGGALAGLGGASARAALTDPLRPAAQLAANQHAAEHDARARLRRVRLPPTDVMPTRTIPAFARSFLASPAPRRGYFDLAQRWEVASASPRALITFVKRHPPAGSTANPGTGSSSDSQTGVTSTDIEFSCPDVPGKLLGRALIVTVVTPPHGLSVVIVQSQAAWVVPRSTSERVPADVHAILITLRLGPATTGPVIKPGGHVQTSRYLVWRAARVRSLLELINGLPIVQPAVAQIACPMMLTGSAASELTLTFETGRGGRMLARAQVDVHRGTTWGDGAGACDPIELSIAGKSQTPLTSPTFVKQVGSLIGAQIS